MDPDAAYEGSEMYHRVGPDPLDQRDGFRELAEIAVAHAMVPYPPPQVRVRGNADRVELVVEQEGERQRVTTARAADGCTFKTIAAKR